MVESTYFHRISLVAFLVSTLHFESRAEITGGNSTTEYSRIYREKEENASYNALLYKDSLGLPYQPNRNLQESEKKTFCDPLAKNNPDFKRYFEGMQSIYRGDAESTCLPAHQECGWPAVNEHSPKKLPLLVLSVGLEGAGHHLWTEILNEPVFDCVWVNARHYRRDIGDGVSRTTSEELHEGISCPIVHSINFCVSLSKLAH